MAVYRFYEDADLLWAEFGPGPEDKGNLVDDTIIEHYNESGEVFALSFLNASDGVDLEPLPDSERKDARTYMQRVGLKERVAA